MNHSRTWPVAVLLLAGPLYAESVTLPAARDNTLFEIVDGSLSNGAGSYLFAGTTGNGAIRRGLIAFDIASVVPAGSIIENVQLALHMSRTPTASELISLHRVNSDWGEGSSVGFGEEGGGAPATSEDATWLHRFFPDVFWTQPGGDFDPIPRASTFVLSNGLYHWASAGMVADVQAWLDNPDANFGWMISGNEEFSFTAKRFDSRENEEPAFRPALAVEYTPIPEPGAAVLWLLAGISCKRRSRRG